MKYLGMLLVLVGLVGCNNTGQKPQTEEPTAAEQPQSGMWRAVISTNDSTDLPFNLLLENKDGHYHATVINGEEEIEIKDIEELGDTLKIQMPVFANYLLLRKGATSMTGEYVNPDADDYRLPLVATYGDSARFEISNENCCDINNKWAVKFSPGTDDESPSIAYFEQNGSQVRGTFLTETGDYRYLDGVLDGNRLKLSTFDGAHLFYFHADIRNGEMMTGRFFSGRSWTEPWIAYRDDSFELRDPESLTYINEGYEGMEFTFPDLNGTAVSLTDERFKGKPVIVQILGSWCPNCMDESRYFQRLYDAYHEEGLEIVGLTFERARDETTALKRAKKMVDDLGLEYTVLLAGSTRQDKAGEALPMLNHVMSYPTSIFLNSQHEVVNIHTGFSGPGTPVYDKYVSETDQLVQSLVNGDKEMAQHQ